MHPPDCPSWEYSGTPGAGQEIHTRAAELLEALRTGTWDPEGIAVNTRPAHRDIFRNLTPPGCTYFAGNYRGAGYRCLEHYEVGIQSDPRVGAPPRIVEWQMKALGSRIKSALTTLRAAREAPDLSADQKRSNAVALACSLFEIFLRIHPYANGNGHAARLMVIAMLGRQGYWLKRFEIDPRPPDPPYSDAIKQYRDGHHHVLEQFVLSLFA